MEELEKRLGTDSKNGLTHDEAEKRIGLYGKNMMTPPKTKPKILIFIGYALAPFSIFLWIASILCFIAYGLDTSSSDNVKKKKKNDLMIVNKIDIKSFFIHF